MSYLFSKLNSFITSCSFSRADFYNLTFIAVLFLNPVPDLEDVYQKAGVARDSLGLTYQDLKMLFGASTPSAHAVACFDDGDRRFSLMELRAALGL